LIHQEASDVKKRKKSKVKFNLITSHEDQEGEQRYIATLSLTSALDWGRDQRHAPAGLSSGIIIRYPLYRKLGELVGMGVENPTPTRIRSPDRPSRSESLYRLHYAGYVDNVVERNAL